MDGGLLLISKKWMDTSFNLRGGRLPCFKLVGNSWTSRQELSDLEYCSSKVPSHPEEDAKRRKFGLHFKEEALYLEVKALGYSKGIGASDLILLLQ